MLTAKVWPSLMIVVLVASAATSSKISESGGKRTRTHQWFWKSALPPPPSFFAGNKPPENLPGISGGTNIQQKLPADPPSTPPYFVSLFDPARNIPFYSAYKVTPAQATAIETHRRKDFNWRNPKDAKGQGIPVDGAYKEAITKYKQPLSRGHMNPSGINSFDQNFMKATFTLTNAAPQFEASNSDLWQTFETRIRTYAKSTCGNSKRGGTLYLLTGTSDFGLKPGSAGKPVQDTTIPLPFTTTTFSKGIKLVTPRAVWTAGCCEWNGKAESFAVMSNNQKDKSLLYQTEMSVADLEVLLTAKGSLGVKLFPGAAKCGDTSSKIILPP
ncbi:uncharacterized protein [Montipora foliosa]|uniref:uncharacterized protein isoform X1 n=1 Tax=Montipora foliosa TaxID=591990 RepID=UPI0035F168D0